MTSLSTIGNASTSHHPSRFTRGSPKRTFSIKRKYSGVIERIPLLKDRPIKLTSFDRWERYHHPHLSFEVANNKYRKQTRHSTYNLQD